jgi:hypothetical protein
VFSSSSGGDQGGALVPLASVGDLDLLKAQIGLIAQHGTSAEKLAAVVNLCKNTTVTRDSLSDVLRRQARLIQ